MRIYSEQLKIISIPDRWETISELLVTMENKGNTMQMVEEQISKNLEVIEVRKSGTRQKELQCSISETYMS